MKSYQKVIPQRYTLDTDSGPIKNNHGVYICQAFDSIENKEVIVKFFNSLNCNYLDYHQRILDFRHINLARYLYISRLSDQYPPQKDIVIQEWINGIPIDQYFRNSPSITLLCKVLLQLLEGIEYLHALKMIHLDIKVSNVLIELRSRRPTAKIIDLESINALNDKMNKKEVTPEYMAPELLKTDYPTVQCDYWSLGCLVFKLFTGCPPFGLRNEGLEVILKNIEKQTHLNKLRFIPNPFRSFIACCLHKNPDKRASSIDDLRALFK